MRIPSKADLAESTAETVPLEVKVWLDKGWTIIPSERRGYVLSGQKEMRNLDRFGLFIGVVLLGGFLFPGFRLLGFLGILLAGGAWIDFKLNTKAPTKFFPEPGEKPRTIERE